MIVEAAQAEPIIVCGDWEVREMILTWPKVELLWKRLQKYKSLFSDITRGNFDNYFRMLTQRNTLWFEIYARFKPGGPSSDVNVFYDDLVGIVWLADIEQVIDGTAHMVFFDRKPSEKVQVCRELIKWVFDRWPLQRVTVTPPEMYYVTHRLLEKIGFKREGMKREAVLINGKWNGVRIYGMVRSEVEALP